jgi:hypothetical protein
MKNFSVLIVVLFVLASSCQRSQFSTTARQYKNGKVSYVNTYHKERSRISKGKSHKNHLTRSDAQNENLIASTSNEPDIILMNKAQVRSTDNLVLSYYHHSGILNDSNLPDTIKSLAPQQGTTMDFSEENVIRLKKGRKISAGFIYQSHDTLFYKSTSNPKITHFVTTGQVDTIYKVKYYDSMKSQVVDTRMPDKLGLGGLILSFIGFIPIVGLPFAVAAVILGAISLRKINRHPEKFSGISKAYGSLILGILGTVISTILIIALAITGGPGSTGLGMGQ